VVTGCNQVDNNTTAAHLPASIACLLPQDPVQLSHDITRATVTNQRQASIQHISAIQDIDGENKSSWTMTYHATTSISDSVEDATELALTLWKETTFMLRCFSFGLTRSIPMY